MVEKDLIHNIFEEITTTFNEFKQINNHLGFSEKEN